MSNGSYKIHKKKKQNNQKAQFIFKLKEYFREDEIKISMKKCLNYNGFFSTTSSGSLTWKQNWRNFKCT